MVCDQLWDTGDRRWSMKSMIFVLHLDQQKYRTCPQNHFIWFLKLERDITTALDRTEETSVATASFGKKKRTWCFFPLFTQCNWEAITADISFPVCLRLSKSLQPCIVKRSYSFCRQSNFLFCCCSGVKGYAVPEDFTCCHEPLLLTVLVTRFAPPSWGGMGWGVGHAGCWSIPFPSGD